MLEGTVVPYCGGKLFVPKEHFTEDVLLAGNVPEHHVNGMFQKFVKPGYVVLDIGANIGFHTFVLKDLVGPGGKIYAVEADIDNAACIRESMRLNNDRQTLLLPVAASDQTGVLFLKSEYHTNSAFSQEQSGSGNDLAICVALDDVINVKVDFIKIDIEGAELLAIKGMKRILEDRPLVATEFCPANMIAVLGEDKSIEYLAEFFDRRYKCYYIDPYGGLRAHESIEKVLATMKWAREEAHWLLIDLLFVPEEVEVDASQLT